MKVNTKDILWISFTGIILVVMGILFFLICAETEKIEAIEQANTPQMNAE